MILRPNRALWIKCRTNRWLTWDIISFNVIIAWCLPTLSETKPAFKKTDIKAAFDCFLRDVYFTINFYVNSLFFSRFFSKGVMPVCLLLPNWALTLLHKLFCVLRQPIRKSIVCIIISKTPYTCLLIINDVLLPYHHSYR